MKKCYTCGLRKPAVEFNKNKSKPDGLNTICRKCSKARSRRYYRENREKHVKDTKKNSNRYIQRNRQFVADYLSVHPCVDCGETNLAKLEFDHLSDKSDNISNMITKPVGLDKLRREIQKCAVRCASCHRFKTAKDQNWWVLKYMGLKH